LNSLRASRAATVCGLGAIVGFAAGVSTSVRWINRKPAATPSGMFSVTS